jgi:hypothetical protein
MVMGEWQ